MAVDTSTDTRTSPLTVDVLDAAGQPAGTVELPEDIFDVQTNVPLIHQVVVAQLAAARQGTHDTKNRGEVRGGGRKPYKQKGTGRARQGSTRAAVHRRWRRARPRPRDYSQRTPKKMKGPPARGPPTAPAGRVHVVGSVDGDARHQGRDAALCRSRQRRNVLVVAERRTS
jgi:large subunit ribosomal protein L4